jgi:hypothetical protein
MTLLHGFILVMAYLYSKLQLIVCELLTEQYSTKFIYIAIISKQI